MYCRVNTHIQSKKVIKEKHVFAHREKDYTNKRAWLLNITKIYGCVNNMKQVVFTNMYITLIFGQPSHLQHHKGGYWEWLLTHLRNIPLFVSDSGGFSLLLEIFLLILTWLKWSKWEPNVREFLRSIYSSQIYSYHIQISIPISYPTFICIHHPWIATEYLNMHVGDMSKYHNHLMEYDTRCYSKTKLSLIKASNIFILNILFM